MTQNAVNASTTHVENAIKMQKLLGLCTDVLEQVKNQANTIAETVSKAYEADAEANGHITSAALKVILTSFKDEIMSEVKEQINELKSGGIVLSGTGNGGSAGEAIHDNPLAEKYPPFCYADEGSSHPQLWQVPKDFSFPSANRETGWKLWLVGMPDFRVTTADGSTKKHPICPFRCFELPRLPKKVRSKFQLAWLPLFKIMEDGLTEFPLDVSEYDSKMFNSSFQSGTENLKKRAEYIFQTRPKHDTWSVSTWSLQLSRSMILQHGTEQDKSNLPAATSHHNNPRKQGLKRKVTKRATTKVARRKR
eukprot:CAMPEP_0185725440 /NCGR_PEP_ID=MMETSP1171-20130828/1707_1 /TAXON_ID=374046 /ORGANISM="Helicotheca tamensis, Strain CCMP826" /LENGTH=306 /DNA_ID=CAMNT_0028393575 /DNA_START=44 /DNA_END=964 /DNA_ORIENTATION=-